MPRPLRRLRAGEVVEITSRTVEGKYAFVPHPLLVLEWIGILTEACTRWPSVKLYMAITMTNHWHGLASCGDANTMSKWSSFVGAATARAAQFHNDLKGPIWGRRLRIIPIIDDESLRERVKYIMAQACSDGCDLVEKPNQWPGMHCVDVLCRGEELKGSYVTAEERRKALRETKTLPLNRALKLAPLPMLPQADDKQQTWFRHIEKEVIAEAKARRERNGKTCASPASFREQDPRYVPKKVKRRPAPLCHAACKASRKAFRKAWGHFEEQWRLALEDFKRNLRASFPPGSWWPYHCRGCWVQLE